MKAFVRFFVVVVMLMQAIVGMAQTSKFAKGGVKGVKTVRSVVKVKVPTAPIVGGVIKGTRQASEVDKKNRQQVIFNPPSWPKPPVVTVSVTPLVTNFEKYSNGEGYCTDLEKKLKYKSSQVPLPSARYLLFKKAKSGDSMACLMLADTLEAEGKTVYATAWRREAVLNYLADSLRHNKADTAEQRCMGRAALRLAKLYYNGVLGVSDMKRFDKYRDIAVSLGVEPKDDDVENW